MTNHARVCIVGGGAMGVGLFYHLALEGWTDVILVEKGELTSGSTWHAAGQCPHFIGSLSMAQIHYYGTVTLRSSRPVRCALQLWDHLFYRERRSR